MIMLRRVYRRSSFSTSSILIVTMLLFLGIINSVSTRSIDPGNLTIDKSEVPARYVFEIDEVQDELNEIDKMGPTHKSHENLDSSLMFDMPIAVSIFSAVMFLVCCFCCLRCAVTYDGIKRSGSYRTKETSSKVVEIVKSLKSKEPMKQ